MAIGSSTVVQTSETSLGGTSLPCWACEALPTYRTTLHLTPQRTLNKRTNQARNIDGHDLKWTNANDDAPWRTTKRTHADYMALLEREGKPIPILFLILTLRLEGVMFDVLHAMDQGVAVHLVANTMVEVMPRWSANEADRAKGLQAPTVCSTYYTMHHT